MSRLMQMLLLALWALPAPADGRDVIVRADDVPENPNATFAITVDVDRADRRYQIGDLVVLRIRSERDCYVTLFDVGTSGNVTVLLPNRYRSDNLIKADKLVSFPGSGDGFNYQVTGPEGLERIVVVGATSPLNLVAEDLAQYESARSVFMTAPPDNARPLMQRARDVLVKAKADEWASDQVTFLIGEAASELPPGGEVPEMPEAPEQPEAPETPEQPEEVGLEAPPTGPPEWSDAGNAWALVAGVADYPGDDMDLGYADDDAGLFAAVLNQVVGIPADHIALLTNAEATPENLGAGIGWLAENAGAEDTVYIFFSGHGGYTQDQDDDEDDGWDEYLCAYGGNILDDDYGQAVHRVKCAKILEFTDTCFSGGTARDVKIKSLMPSSRGLDKPIKDGFGPMEWRVRTREMAPEGVCLFAASRPDQPSQESPALEHGVFTYFLARGLVGEADANGDDAITLQELYAYTRQQVSGATGGMQEPFLLPEHGDAVLRQGTFSAREITPIAVE